MSHRLEGRCQRSRGTAPPPRASRRPSGARSAAARASSPPRGVPPARPAARWPPAPGQGETGVKPCPGGRRSSHGSARSLPTLLEGLLALSLFLPDTRLLRMRRKDCRRDFLRDFTRDRGPSMASESLGCSVHLRAPTSLSARTPATSLCSGGSPALRTAPIPGQHRVAPVIVEESEAVAGAEGHEVPLGVESDGGDGSGGHTLHQHAGLEAGGKGQGPVPRGQSVVALPGEALAVLQQVHRGHADHVLRLLVTQLHHQHLQGTSTDGGGCMLDPPQESRPAASRELNPGDRSPSRTGTGVCRV